MPMDALAPLASLSSLPRLAPLSPNEATGAAPAAGGTGGSGFGTLLNNILDGNRQANAAADAAVRDLATGEAQDLHTVSLAIAQAEVSFRLILEIRNRLSDALQEVTRMQV
jgi:flagellar hook-basal body complex protein FliE